MLPTQGRGAGGSGGIGHCRMIESNHQTGVKSLTVKEGSYKYGKWETKTNPVVLNLNPGIGVNYDFQLI